MGHTEFLVGNNASAPSDLPGSIDDLEDASIVFVNRWARQDYKRAGDVSADAMPLLDFIANELLREKDSHKGLGSYTGSRFAAEMSMDCGVGVTGVTLSDQQAMVASGAGAGQIDPQLGAPRQLSLDRLLQKIKHRNRGLVNFRIDQGRHIFLICPEQPGGGAEGIYEFDVQAFCERCRRAANQL